MSPSLSISTAAFVSKSEAGGQVSNRWSQKTEQSINHFTYFSMYFPSTSFFVIFFSHLNQKALTQEVPECCNQTAEILQKKRLVCLLCYYMPPLLQIKTEQGQSLFHVNPTSITRGSYLKTHPGTERSEQTNLSIK